MLPGVTSFCAVAAQLGRSLTEMDLPLHIIPASGMDLDAALTLPGTKVLMKSGSAIHETVAALGRAGLLKRASMVADCGLPSERVFRDLREIPENVSYFATILVRSE
jgi:precorrin-2/cobalt-factor-2 C20-methyltransferase